MNKKDCDEEYVLFSTNGKNMFENSGRTEKEVGECCRGCLHAHRSSVHDKTLGKWAKKKAKVFRQRIKSE